MKVAHKRTLLIVSAILILAIAIPVVDSKNHSANSSTDSQNSQASSVTTWPIRMPNSSDEVLIEGLTTADAEALDRIFRSYEQMDANTDPETSLERIRQHIMQKAAPAVLEWFDPDFDLITAFHQAEDDCEGKTLKWLAKSLSEDMTDSEHANEFYYVMDESGVYRMSIDYFLAGYVYTSITMNSHSQ